VYKRANSGSVLPLEKPLLCGWGHLYCDPHIGESVEISCKIAWISCRWLEILLEHGADEDSVDHIGLEEVSVWKECAT